MLPPSKIVRPTRPHGSQCLRPAPGRHRRIGVLIHWTPAATTVPVLVAGYDTARDSGRRSHSRRSDTRSAARGPVRTTLVFRTSGLQVGRRREQHGQSVSAASQQDIKILRERARWFYHFFKIFFAYFFEFPSNSDADRLRARPRKI